MNLTSLASRNIAVRPDEAQKILSVLRKHGSHTVIDMITVKLDYVYVEEEKKNGFPIQMPHIESPISTKRFPQTASLFPVDRPQ